MNPSARVTLPSVALFLASAAAVRAAETPATSSTADASAPAAETLELDQLTVFSSRVALQEPSGALAAPVSALRFEPQVDVQARNFAEGQADVTIRGGTFENTGFTVGALPIYDPQTGHYSAELPVSPYLLGAPEIQVGAAHAATGFNATAGGVDYGWRRIRTGGAVSAGFGGDDLARGELYAGVASTEKLGGFTVGADVSVAQAEGDGPREWRDTNAVQRDSHFDFGRINGRVQLANDVSQTDFFAGYQSKDLIWPNLYAARPTTALRAEREQLQTKLFVVNHRTELSADGDYVQAGAYYRGHRDNYFIPLFGVTATNPSRHQTVVRGAALDGRQSFTERTALRYAAGAVGDDLDSNTLINGNFMSRSQFYSSLLAEHTIPLTATQDLVISAGGRYDDSNRDSSEISPLTTVELRRDEGTLRRLYASYSETSQLPTYQALNAASPGLFAGDPNLPRATAQNIELGAEFVREGWKTRASVFYRNDDNLLDYVYNPTAPTVPAAASNRFATAVDLDTYGVELFATRTWERIDLFAGYTFLTKDDNYTAPLDGSFYALNYAEHRLTLGAIARLGAGFELRADNELRRQADNALRREGNDNVDTAVGLFYHVPAVKGLVINVQVENLWDTAFQDVPLVPHTPRTWSAGATYVW